MNDENNKNEGEEQRRLPPNSPVNNNNSNNNNIQLCHTGLNTTLGILGKLVLTLLVIVAGLAERLAELKILVSENMKKCDVKQKIVQLLDENRRLRKQVTRLQKSRSSHADSAKNQNVLVTSNQLSRKRKHKNICKNNMEFKSPTTRRTERPMKTLRTDENKREYDNDVFQDNDSEDTIAKAMRARQAQGLHECEYSFGGEVDLHKHCTDCTKNPGHLQFTPKDQFDIDCLPVGFKDADIVDCIRALADITVRVDVKPASKEQPLTTGTGWILVVKEYPIWYNGKVCPCSECKSPSIPKTQFAEFVVYTAGHVVKDETDGQSTTCHLFFDREGTPANCDGVISLDGVIRVVSDQDGDRCEMTIVTHDLVLADRLHKMVKLYRDLNAKVWSKYVSTYDSTSQQKQGQAKNKNTLTIIVSHPHGCSKQVSIGHYTLRKELAEGRDVTKYYYTAATCYGSSGAPVYILGKPAWGMCEHPHHGISEENPEQNCSGYGLF